MKYKLSITLDNLKILFHKKMTHYEYNQLYAALSMNTTEFLSQLPLMADFILSVFKINNEGLYFPMRFFQFTLRITKFFE